MLKKLFVAFILTTLTLRAFAVDPVAQAEITPPSAEEPLTLAQIQPLADSTASLNVPQNMLQQPNKPGTPANSTTNAP